VDVKYRCRSELTGLPIWNCRTKSFIYPLSYL